MWHFAWRNKIQHPPQQMCSKFWPLCIIDLPLVCACFPTHAIIHFQLLSNSKCGKIVRVSVERRLLLCSANPVMPCHAVHWLQVCMMIKGFQMQSQEENSNVSHTHTHIHTEWVSTIILIFYGLYSKGFIAFVYNILRLSKAWLSLFPKFLALNPTQEGEPACFLHSAFMYAFSLHASLAVF